MDTRHLVDPELLPLVDQHADLSVNAQTLGGLRHRRMPRRRQTNKKAEMQTCLKFFLVIGSLAFLVASASSQNNKGAVSMNKVAGMWKPVSIEANLQGKKIAPFGPNPNGLLVFGENLHFVEVIQNPDVPKFASNDRLNGTAEENKAAVVGNLGLYGTYTVDSDGNFTGNHVDGSTFPNWQGNDRGHGQLTEVVEGDTMTETFHDGNALVVSIVWHRVK